MKQFSHEIMSFEEYLRATSKIHYQMIARSSEGHLVFLEKGYKHRWSIEYKRDLLRRFYLLRDWHIEQFVKKSTLFTLTTYQKGLTHREQLRLLRKAWDSVIDLLGHEFKRLGLPKPEFVKIIEAHKSGYAHIHCILFADIPFETQMKLRRLYAVNYNAGSFEHGLDFSSGTKEIDHIIAYVLKYITPDPLHAQGDWILQNTIYEAWHDEENPERYRTVTFSRGISRYIRDHSDNEGYRFLLVAQDGDTVYEDTQLVLERGNRKRNEEMMDLPIGFGEPMLGTPLTDEISDFKDKLCNLTI